MFKTITSVPLMIFVGLILISGIVITNTQSTTSTDLIIANTDDGNDSEAIDYPPPSTIDQFLKLIRGSSNESSATRNS